MNHLFISYTLTDRTWAEWIAAELQAAGYAVHYQARDFRPTGSFMGEMDEALKQAASTVAVLSKDYLASPYCAAEWKAALAQDPTGAQGRLLLVRVGQCSLTGLLAPFTYVDLAAVTDIVDARARLLGGVKASPAAAAAAGAAAVPPTGRRRNQPLFPPQRLQRLAWRAGTALAACAGVAVAVSSYLGRYFPHWMAEAPLQLNAAALVCGSVVAAVLDATLQWRWNHRQLAPAQ